MGRVRTKYIKRKAHELIDKKVGAFGNNFEKNKQILNEVVLIQSKHLRNRLAGYITSLLKNKQKIKEQGVN